MVRFILTWIATPLLALLLAPQLAGMVVAIHQGDILGWLARTSWLTRIGLGLFVLSVGLVVALRRRPIRADWIAGIPFVRFWSRYREQGERTGDIDHEGVVWRIEVHGSGPLPAYRSPDAPPPDLLVRIPPRCPNCRHELTESGHGHDYRRQCPACGFETTSHRSFRQAVEHIEKLARRGWNMSARKHAQRH